MIQAGRDEEGQGITLPLLLEEAECAVNER